MDHHRRSFILVSAKRKMKWKKGEKKLDFRYVLKSIRRQAAGPQLLLMLTNHDSVIMEMTTLSWSLLLHFQDH